MFKPVTSLSGMVDDQVLKLRLLVRRRHYADAGHFDELGLPDAPPRPGPVAREQARWLAAGREATEAAFASRLADKVLEHAARS